MRIKLAMMIAAVATIALCGCASNSAVPAPARSVGQTSDIVLPQQILHSTFTDSNGRELTIASLRGKIVVISDMMTLCQGTCPLDTANVTAAARRVRAAGLNDRVVFLSISIDPARDTRPRLGAYRRLYSPAPADWLTMSGSVATLTRFWNTLGVFRKKELDTGPAPHDWMTTKLLTYDITHSDQVFFLDERGHQRFELDGVPHVAPGTPIPRTLLNFLSAEGRRDLAHPDAESWTLSQELQILGWLLNKPL